MTLLTTTQAALQLDMTRNGVNKLIAKKELPAIRVGRDWLIERSDVRNAKKNRPKPGRRWPERPTV